MLAFNPEVASLPDQSRKLQDLVGCIYVQGLPTQATFLMCTMLNVLKAHYPQIRSDACTQYTHNPTTGPEWLLSRITQEVVWRGKSAPSADVAMVAKSGGGRPLCAACQSTGHSKQTCWQVGGDMFGKEAEQCEIIRKRREENGGFKGRGGKPGGRGGKSDHNPFCKTTDGCSFVIDADTKEAVFITQSNTSESTVAITSPALSSFPPSGTSNLALMAMHAPLASLIPKTWSFDNSDDDDYNYLCREEQVNRLYLSEAGTPTGGAPLPLFDSGSTTNISPVRSDFFEFKVIFLHVRSTDSVGQPVRSGSDVLGLGRCWAMVTSYWTMSSMYLALAYI